LITQINLYKYNKNDVFLINLVIILKALLESLEAQIWNTNKCNTFWNIFTCDMSPKKISWPKKNSSVTMTLHKQQQWYFLLSTVFFHCQKIDSENRTHRRIDGCNVKRVSSLKFDFYLGACNTYQFGMEKILFCFGSGTKRECHM